MGAPNHDRCNRLPRRELHGFERKHLCGMAHGLEPVVQIGRDGVSDAAIAAVREALIAHELIKVRLRQPKDKRSMAEMLAQRASAHLCGLIGHIAILYRQHPKRPQIVLPAE